MKQELELVQINELTPNYFLQQNCHINPGFFTEMGMTKLLEDMKRAATSFAGDISTERGRDEIKRYARLFSSSKVVLEDFAKKMEADAKKIAEQRIRMTKEMDFLRDLIKAPVDEFEQREKDRVAAREERIAQINSYFNIAINSAAEARKYINDLTTYEQFDWQEFGLKAKEMAVRAAEYLDKKLTEWTKIEEDREKLKKFEAQEAENKRLEDERLQKEREERIAAEAAERAKKQAEEKAEADKKVADEAIKNAELRAAEAERLAKEQAEQADKRAKEMADKAAKEEREKIEAEKRREEELAVKREANKRHCAKINNEALEAIRGNINGMFDDEARKLAEEHGKSLDYCVAKIIVEAIAEGLIPNITIKY